MVGRLHCQRLLVARAHMFIVASRNRSYRGIELFILDGKTLEILRLISLTRKPTSGCAVIAKLAADTVVIARTRQ